MKMKDKIREWYLKDKKKDEPFAYWVLRKKIESYKAGKCSIRDIEMEINWIETMNWHIKNMKTKDLNSSVE